MVRVDPGNWILKTLQFNPGKDLLLYQLKHDDVMGLRFGVRMTALTGNVFKRTFSGSPPHSA